MTAQTVKEQMYAASSSPMTHCSTCTSSFQTILQKWNLLHGSSLATNRFLTRRYCTCTLTSQEFMKFCKIQPKFPKSEHNRHWKYTPKSPRRLVSVNLRWLNCDHHWGLWFWCPWKFKRGKQQWNKALVMIWDVLDPQLMSHEEDEI